MPHKKIYTSKQGQMAPAMILRIVPRGFFGASWHFLPKTPWDSIPGPAGSFTESVLVFYRAKKPGKEEKRKKLAAYVLRDDEG